MPARGQLRLRLVTALTTASAVAALVGGAAVSQAAVIGNLTFAPTAGSDSTAMTVDTSGPCLQGDSFQVFVTGAGFPAVGYPVSADTDLTDLVGNAKNGYTIALTGTMQSLAAAQSPPATLSGRYAFSGRCTDAAGGSVFDTYVGAVDFSQNGADAPTYVATIDVVFGTFTATALSASPAGPVNAGVPVVFTAHVASSPTGGALGTVQLMDGTDPLGSPTSVDGSGNAEITTAFRTAGDHSVTAAFTGRFAFITDSVSSPLVYRVNATPADPTTTAVAIAPGSATPADTVTLTASVADVPHPTRAPAGTVQFADAGGRLGPPVGVDAAGEATLSRSYAAGAHSFTAAFVPSAPSDFAPSASTSQTYTVAAAASVSQPIETTVDPGSLTISIAESGPVVLPPPQLNATATFLTTVGALHAITVTDTRAGNPGWVLSAQVSDFAGPDGDIPGVDLGWTPTLLDDSQGQQVVLGPVVLAASPPLVADPAHDGATGLHASRTLASAAAGKGTGTAQVGADLSLDVPTSEPAGRYDATLTITAI